MAFDEILDHFEPKEKSKTVVKKRESMGTNSNQSRDKNISFKGNSPERVGMPIGAFLPNRFQAPGMM